MLRRAVVVTSTFVKKTALLKRFFSSREGLPTPVRFMGRFEQSQTPSPTLPTQTPYAYRGDRRCIEILQRDNGFFAGNSNFRLDHHIKKTLKKDEDGNPIPGVYEPSGYVSVSLSEKTAETFAQISFSPVQTVYAMARPMIHVAPFHDVAARMDVRPMLALDEAEIPAIQSIALTEIVAYKITNRSATFGPWQLNREFIPRDFSVAIRSADESEARRLDAGRPYCYPLYSTAKIIADVLNDASKEYGGVARFMTCFEEVRTEDVEQTLGKRPDSGFSEAELPRYYEEKFHRVQREMGRRRMKFHFGGPDTFFAAENRPQSSTPQQAVAQTREEVIAYLEEENSRAMRESIGLQTEKESQAGLKQRL